MLCCIYTLFVGCDTKSFGSFFINHEQANHLHERHLDIRITILDSLNPSFPKLRDWDFPETFKH